MPCFMHCELLATCRTLGGLNFRHAGVVDVSVSSSWLVDVDIERKIVHLTPCSNGLNLP